MFYRRESNLGSKQPSYLMYSNNVWVIQKLHCSYFSLYLKNKALCIRKTERHRFESIGALYDQKVQVPRKETRNLYILGKFRVYFLSAGIAKGQHLLQKCTLLVC